MQRLWPDDAAGLEVWEIGHHDGQRCSDGDSTGDSQGRCMRMGTGR